ncbi:MAG: type II toxin-antitoxin system VapC family toxin [Chloroflexota bacterium]
MIPPLVVLDASGPLARVLSEPEAPMMAAATARWSRTGARILVPDHFWLEITNPLIRRHRWSTAEVAAALRELDALSPEVVAADRPLLLLATELAEQHGLTTYDAMYAALAQVTGATLATFDRALRRAFPSLLEPGFGEIPPLGVHEAAVPYRADRPERPAGWTDWSEVGRYLGVLRRRAIADAEAGRP